MRILRSIIRRIATLFKEKPQLMYVDLIKQGHMSVGRNCNLNGVNIIMVEKKSGIKNVEIGDNCCIQGTIMLYRSSSKIKIGNNVYIGPGTMLECVDEIEIGNHVLISLQCNIIDTNSHSIHSYDRVNDTVDWQKGLQFKNWDNVVIKKIKIGDHCWIGLRSILTKGVSLGNGSIVGAGSVVTKSTEPFTLIAGNPAVFIKNVD